MFRSFLLALPFMSFGAYVEAHEFWIEPVNWQVEPGSLIEAHIRTGQEMVGSALPYLPSGTRRFEVLTPNGIVKAGGKIGDRPVLKGTANDPGLYVVIYQTKPEVLKYNDFETFEDFVQHKDLSGALENHRERSLPSAGFVENFSRFAKSLIAVGEGKGSDRTFGLLIEFTALKNPYTADTSEELEFLLTYRGAPRPDAQVEIFERDPEGSVSIQTVRTTENGIAGFKAKPGHDYMLDSVVLRPRKARKEGDAVWESLWANLTFSVPGE